MPKRPLGVLSLGILIVILAASAVVFAADAGNFLLYTSKIFSLTLIVFGLWVVGLAGIRASNPEIYGHGAFNLFSGGILITTLGAAWFLYIIELYRVHLFPVVVLILGILVVAAAIRTWRGK
jgi:hypothetical protein